MVLVMCGRSVALSLCAGLVAGDQREGEGLSQCRCADPAEGVSSTVGDCASLSPRGDLFEILLCQERCAVWEQLGA